MWRTTLLLLCSSFSISTSFLAPRPSPSLSSRVARHAWEPRADAVVDGSRGTYGYWFDPLKAFDYAHPSPVQPAATLEDGSLNLDQHGRPKPRPLLLFLPPVVGNALAPFAQYPHLDRVFNVRAFKTDLDVDVRTPEVYNAFVAELATFCREQIAEGHDVYLSGECSGGVQALAVAMAMSEDNGDAGYTNPLKGVVMINPATSHTTKPDLIATTKILLDPKTSKIRWAWETFWYCATRGYSKSEFPRFVALMLDNPLFDPKKCPAELQRYFFDAIPAFLAELQLPHPCWLSGIRTIECGAHVVEDELAERRAKMGDQLLGTPLLIVAGTDDEFVGMREEAPRLKELVDGDTAHADADSYQNRWAASGGIAAPTTIHWVEGAGHVSTLDDRCDLTVVMSRWIRSHYGTAAAPPPLSALEQNLAMAATAAAEQDAEEPFQTVEQFEAIDYEGVESALSEALDSETALVSESV